MTPAAALLIGLALAAAAPSDPAAGERRAILDAMRPAIEAQLGPRVEFVVQTIKVDRGWAFVVADPRRKGGAAIDGWALFGEHYGNMDGLRVEAVLRRQRGGWTLVEKAIGATDVWYCDVGPRALKAGLGC